MPTLDWIGKPGVVNHHRKVPYHLLRSKNLLPYYPGKVECLYIDPPYNTRNEGWAYKDNVNTPEIRGPSKYHEPTVMEDTPT